MDSFVGFITTYQLAAVFVGSFVFGDSVIFTSAYLAGQLGWEALPVFSAAFLGSILADSAWYWGGRWLGMRFADSEFLRRERDIADSFLRRLVGVRPYMALVFVKFLYGARIAMILYAAGRRMPFWVFSVFNGLGTLLWFCIFFPLAFSAGKRVEEFLPSLNVLETAILVLVISTIVFRLVTLWLTRHITRQ